MRRSNTYRALAAWAMMAIATAATAQTLQQTAGIYTAYAEPSGIYTEAPDGYMPVYISHYGRHGSRWITDDKRYTDVMDMLADTTALTPYGKDVRCRLEIVLDDAIGRSGALSPVGERQHRAIGRRMIERYPGLFADSARVNAVSSTSLRCAMSMGFFTEALKEVNPALQISRTAYNKDMAYIAHVTPEGKKFSADTAAWRSDYWQFVYQTVHPGRLMASLFVDPDLLTLDQQLTLGAGLYWIVSDMQDIDLEMDLYDLMTYDELRQYWRCVNARMYVCNGDSPWADGVMLHCADNLLGEIVAKADAALGGRGPAADLRFGHDTHLLRLLALMGMEGCTGREDDIYRFDQVWRDYELSPMAANLQLIYYSNAEGDILVKMLLNEEEKSIPALGAGPYYRWTDLRPYLLSKISE